MHIGAHWNLIGFASGFSDIGLNIGLTCRASGSQVGLKVDAAVCWCAVFVGCGRACGAPRGAERARILQFLCLRTAEHASRGNAGNYGQIWCAGATRPGLGSHVPCVAGARIRASSAKLVWDIKACGADGASAASGRARGVAG